MFKLNIFYLVLFPIPSLRDLPVYAFCLHKAERKLTISTEEFSFFLMEIQARLVLAVVFVGEETRGWRRKRRSK
jgi:hypothetical protein